MQWTLILALLSFVFHSAFSDRQTLGATLTYCDNDSSCLSSKLGNFDVVHAERVHRRIRKRGTDNPDPSRYNRFEEINIPAFNQNLRLYLTPKKGLFDPNVKIYEILDDKYRKELYVNPEEFLTGHLFGVPYSRANAHFDENGALTGSIEIENDIIMMEPAWRHISGSPVNATLVYKVSDYEKTVQEKKADHQHSTPVCGFVQIDESNMVNSSYFLDAQLRPKRQTDSSAAEKNRCPVKLIADYLFFEKIGNKKSALAARYLISVIDRVNAIYTSTVWQDSPSSPGLTNQGLLIKEVVVHTKPNIRPDHYNTELPPNRKWNVEKLLDTFTKQEGSNKFCLVHLFTYQAFDGGVLGLGYIASPKIGTSGGICSAAARADGRLKFYNTALSSARSTYGDAVITREADIVTAHEFGHNWGSPHDPQTTECSPSSGGGGAFIMHTYSVQGYDSNNKAFSPCSKRSIKAVLTSKSDLCFTENVERFCGNNRVESGEECDPGVLEDSIQDPCCTRDCKLRPGKQCSPKNAACCTNECKFTEYGRECLEANRQDCKQASYCNGTSGECPTPAYMNDEESCRNDGECQNGECVSFCEKTSINMKPCICEQLNESCTRCCRGLSPDSKCAPYPPQTRLSPGTPCIVGICDEHGVCQKGAQDVVQHLWNIIDRLDINNVSKFLEDNLVGTIIILSLVVWIPASLVVNHLDKKKEKERQKTLDWLMGDALVADRDRVEVVRDIKTLHL